MNGSKPCIVIWKMEADLKATMDRDALGQDLMDQDTACALVDAGFMPLRDDLAMFGNDVTAPSTAPDLSDMDAGDHRPTQPSIVSQPLDVLHHH